MIPYIISERALTVFASDEDLVMHRDDDKWEDAMQAIRDEDESRLVELMQPAIAVVRVAKASGGRLVLSGDAVYFDGEALDEDYAVSKILTFASDGLPVEPLVNFLEKLMSNPSFRVRKDLLMFLEKNDLPITSTGDFLAYKYTRADGLDAHSGKVAYNLHTQVSMPRHLVDDNPNNTCSHGLHVAGRHYFDDGWDKRFIVCRVNPKDVVSIPDDYNHSKMRVCSLYVEEEIQRPEKDNIWGESVVNKYNF